MAGKKIKGFQVHVVEVAVGDEDEIQGRKVRERNARGFVPF
jgi:predicted RNA-binding protein with TRAM domain